MKPILLFIAMWCCLPTQQDGLRSKVVGKWTLANVWMKTGKEGRRHISGIRPNRRMEFREDGTAVLYAAKGEEPFRWSVEAQKMTIEYCGNSDGYRLWSNAFEVTLKERYQTKDLYLEHPKIAIALFN